MAGRDCWGARARGEKEKETPDKEGEGGEAEARQIANVGLCERAARPAGCMRCRRIRQRQAPLLPLRQERTVQCMVSREKVAIRNAKGKKGWRRLWKEISFSHIIHDEVALGIRQEVGEQEGPASIEQEHG